MEHSLARQGLAVARTIDTGNVRIGLSPKLSSGLIQYHDAGNGDFACLTGTASVNGRVGAAAVEQLPGVDLDAPAWQRLTGNFCALVGRGNSVSLFVDRLGVYQVYRDLESRIFSSSFLAVASALPQLHADTQGVYEYVHQEAAHGGDTVIEEIKVIDPTGRYEVAPGMRFVPWPAQPAIAGARADLPTNRDACLALLRENYTAIASSFGDDVDTALSGGYDSRLTVALLREQGVTPSVHVYGRESDADVRVARRIAEGEHIALRHIDKRLLPRASEAGFAETVKANFLLFDGYPNDGIFEGGVDARTRRERAADGKLMLNGGGGEIFRNFFYLADRPFRSIDIVRAFYSRYHPGWCTQRFVERQYLATLARKIQRVAGHDRPRLLRSEVEYLYPAFRCAYWMGRNNSVNNRIGWSLTPFADYELARLTSAIPLRQKNYGRIEAEMIRSVSPRLAGYLSDYGHDFSGPPPLRRKLRDNATILRPTMLRPYTYRLKFRRPHPRPDYLRPPLIDSVLDTSFPRLSHFFLVDRVNDPRAYGRISTLEYLFDQLNVKTG